MVLKKDIKKEKVKKKTAPRKTAGQKKTPKKAETPKAKPSPKKASSKGAATAKKPAKKAAARRAPAKPAAKDDFPTLLHKAALKVLDEKKAAEIVSVDLRGRSALTDYVLIASGQSSRQVSALADYLGRAFSKLGVKRVRIEGLPQADWVLVDAGDVLVHLFRPEVRGYYGLEEILKAKPKA